MKATLDGADRRISQPAWRDLNMEQDTGQLLERLMRLEHEQTRLARANRRLRIATAAMVVAAGAAMLMAQTSTNQNQTVDTQQLVLRDSGGNVRGALGVLPSGAV